MVNNINLNKYGVIRSTSSFLLSDFTNKITVDGVPVVKAIIRESTNSLIITLHEDHTNNGEGLKGIKKL